MWLPERLWRDWAAAQRRRGLGVPDSLAEALGVPPDGEGGPAGVAGPRLVVCEDGEAAAARLRLQQSVQQNVLLAAVERAATAAATRGAAAVDAADARGRSGGAGGEAAAAAFRAVSEAQTLSKGLRAPAAAVWVRTDGVWEAPGAGCAGAAAS